MWQCHFPPLWHPLSVFWILKYHLKAMWLHQKRRKNKKGGWFKLKLRQIIGLSLRESFIIHKYSIFLDVILLAFFSMLGFSSTFCLIFFIAYFVIWIIITQSFKCPKCNTKLTETYSIFSKYYKGGFHRVPQKCPCCGQDLDEVWWRD